MTTITFAGTSLQTSNIVCAGIQHEDIAQKNLNVQKYGVREGGKFVVSTFDVKKITLSGYIKGSSQSDLEGRVDDFKKLLNKFEQNLDIEYRGGTRRFKATMTQLLFDRKHWNIDYLPWEATFTVTDPPLGRSLDTSTLVMAANVLSSASTVTGTQNGFEDFGGTFRPRPILKFTFTSINGFRRLQFLNTDEEGELTATQIQNLKLYDGDIITIDMEKSEVRLNGTLIDYDFGLPKFSLSNNTYRLKIIAQDYNVSFKVIYTPLWL